MIGRSVWNGCGLFPFEEFSRDPHAGSFDEDVKYRRNGQRDQQMTTERVKLKVECVEVTGAKMNCDSHASGLHCAESKPKVPFRNVNNR